MGLQSGSLQSRGDGCCNKFGTICKREAVCLGQAEREKLPSLATWRSFAAKRQAQSKVVSMILPKRIRTAEAGEGINSAYCSFFVPTPESRTSRKRLKGMAGTRTRDLCRDRVALGWN